MCGWQPNVDVVIDESSRTLVVRAELAGADSEEIADGGFMKSIPLPVAIAQAEITASYEDGMLTIALPISADEYIPADRTEIRMIVKRVLA